MNLLGSSAVGPMPNVRLVPRSSMGFQTSPQCFVQLSERRFNPNVSRMVESYRVGGTSLSNSVNRLTVNPAESVVY